MPISLTPLQRRHLIAIQKMETVTSKRLPKKTTYKVVNVLYTKGYLDREKVDNPEYKQGTKEPKQIFSY